MQWMPLTDVGQIDLIKEISFNKNIVLFKHSTRCSISDMAKGRLDHSEPIENVDFYYLDLIAYRDLSNKIAEQFQVHHESPQLLLIQNGECTYAESHNGIRMEELKEQISQ